jgi:hypothetical protein
MLFDDMSLTKISQPDVFFSASDLVKRSAAQILYKKLHAVDWKRSNEQVLGDNYAKSIAARENASSERRGTVDIDNLKLFFCVDLVKDNKFVEIKMVMDEDNCETWYLPMSILQATFYATLLSRVTHLDTPRFRQNEGFKQIKTKVPSDFEFELWFGDNQKFRIFPNVEIYDHYVKKMKIIERGFQNVDYTECRAFDAKFKFKEPEIFKPKYLII